MKQRWLLALGKFLMKHGKLSVWIVDDEAVFFNDQMLRLAKSAGYSDIQRFYTIDAVLLNRIFESPPDILILDIVGIASGEIAKDGFDVAAEVFKHTHTYVAITSSQQFYLKEVAKASDAYDHIIRDRLLTAVDFIRQLDWMTEDYLHRKIRFWQKMLVRIGLKIIKGSALRIDTAQAL